MKYLSKFLKTQRILALTVLLFAGFFSQAQTEFYFVPHTTGNNVRMDVVTKGFDNLLNVQFTIHWDSTVLSFQSYGDIHPDIVAAGETNYGINELDGGNVSFLFIDIDGLTLDDGSSLFSIYFEKLNDNFSEIEVAGYPTAIEVANASGEILNPVFHAALVNTGSITGRVIFDENANCSTDVAEQGLVNWKVRAVSGSDVFYGLTRDDGSYAVYVPDGDYEVEVILNNDYYDTGCVGATAVSISNQSNEIVDFFPTQIVTCPYMEVDISTAILRRCFPGTYTVKYCNYGTAPAENTTIEVAFDDSISVDSTEIPVLSQDGNVYTFDIGDVAIGGCGRFNVYYTVPCDIPLGQTLCAEAHIFPDSTCLSPNPEWSGAFIKINGSCDGDNVNFRIENTGTGDMVDPGSYIIIEDGVLLLTEPVQFLLNSGEYVDVSYDANGATYIAKANQVPNYPGQSMPIAAIEACGTNESGTFSVGYVTQFPEDDAEPFLSADCQEVVGSYDSNAKRGYPKGYGDHHFIDRGQDIEYLIDFQNVGTDTAFDVVIKDVIDPSLDIASLIFETSSHPYEADFYGDTLIMTFDNIVLPDSNANEQSSHGFVKFRISQKEDLPLGTIIHNSALIYFDFNEPIVTNATTHEIGEDYILVDLAEPYLRDLNFTVAPNPFTTTTTINLDGVDFKQGQWALYDILGKRMKTETFYDKYFEITSEGLSSGTYFLRITLDSLPAGTGKIIVGHSSN